MTATIRLFAAAAATTGLDTTTSGAPTVGALVAELATGGPAAADVLARCSFLVDGVHTAAHDTPIPDGVTVDVLPPFAGG